MSTAIGNGQLVDALRMALAHTDGLETTPMILRRVLDEEAWRDRIEHRIGQHYVFATFEEFVEAKPLDGLGMHVADIEAILKVREEHDLLRRLREACKQKPGPKAVEKGNGQVRVPRPAPKSSASNRRIIHRGGTNRDTTLARLHGQHAALYQQVIAGQMSANAAAIKAGFRKPTATIPVDSADHAIDALLRRFDFVELREAFKRREDDR
jgi:hypothetical protein